MDWSLFDCYNPTFISNIINLGEHGVPGVGFYEELPNMAAGGPVHDGEVVADESCFAEVARFRVCPREGQYGIQVPLGAWHSVAVLEGSTILEAKDGAYAPGK